MDNYNFWQDLFERKKRDIHPAFCFGLL